MDGQLGSTSDKLCIKGKLVTCDTEEDTTVSGKYTCTNNKWTLTPTIKVGDVDCDGEVLLKDAFLIKDYWINKKTQFLKSDGTTICASGPQAIKVGDVDCDGEVLLKDAFLTKDYWINKKTQFLKSDGKTECK